MTKDNILLYERDGISIEAYNGFWDDNDYDAAIRIRISYPGYDLRLDQFKVLHRMMQNVIDELDK